MQIYLVEDPNVEGYDVYDSFVCSAFDEEQARYTSPSEYYVWQPDGWHFQYYDKHQENARKRDDWANDPKTLDVKVVGVSTVDPGVILASFNPG